MRIAHITATFPPYRGGTGNVCAHNARELARRGHDVTVLTAAGPGALADERWEGVRVRRLRPMVRVGNAPLLPGLVGALRGFDLVHLHYPFILGAELARAATALSGAPLVLSFHNDLIGDGARATIFAAYQALSARLVVRRADRLCVVSLDHYESSRLRRDLRPGRPAAVELPNGVDIAHFCPGAAPALLRERYGIPADAPLALFVAALDRAHHFKGLERLLAAMALLPAEMRLLVVGDGDLRASYERRAVELGLGERVCFAGAVAHADTAACYRAADLTVLPSSPPESFGLVLIESLACATPVVASDIPGVRTVVRHGQDGLLVPEGDVRALAGAVGRLLSDGELRRAMGRRGRAAVAGRYSWEQIGARLEGIYHELLAEPAVPVKARRVARERL